MNFSTFKKLVFPLLAAAVFSACDKPVTTDQLADKGANMIRVTTYGGIDANFSNAAVQLDLTSTDDYSVDFQLEYIGPHVFGQDLTVTVAVNDAARTAFNTANPANQFDVLPASYYTLSTTTATIKAGDVFSTPITITFHNPSQFDPAVSYMVPVSITSIAGGSNGVEAAPSTGTAYFHIIGNPLAGNYLANGYVYHPTVPRAIVDVAKNLSPNSPDELFWDWGDLGANGYFGILKTDPATNKVTVRIGPGSAGGAFTQFDDGLPSSNPGYTPQWPNSAQCNNTYDPATKTFKLRVGYLNSVSGWRVAEEFDVKQ